MKKTIKTKLLCLLLCFCMCLPTLTACGQPLQWEMTESDVMVIEASAVSDEGSTKLIVQHTEDILSSVSKNQVKILSYRILDGSAEASASLPVTAPAEVTNYTVAQDSAKQLTVTLPKGEKNTGYSIYIHSSATLSGKFCEAIAFDGDPSSIVPTYSAAVTGSYAVGDTDPIITVQLENTVASEGLTKEMITLTGIFEGLTVESVAGSGNELTLVTKGTIAFSSTFAGGVLFAKEATHAGVALAAKCEVYNRSVSITQDAFRFADGVLYFEAVFGGDTVLLAAGDTLTADGATYTVVSVSEDKKTVTFSLPVDAEGIDEALAKVEGKTVTLGAAQTASATAQSFAIYANKALFCASVDSVKATDDADTYDVTVLLFLRNGKWASAPVADDFVFFEEFEGASIVSITEKNGIYEMKLTLRKEDTDATIISLHGSLCLNNGKVENAWGTTLATVEEELSYAPPMDRVGALTSIINFIASHKDTFQTISTVAKGVGTAASFFNGVQTILGLVGVIDSVSAKIDQLKAQLDEISASIAALDKKMDALNSTVISTAAQTMTAVQQATYVAASGNWSNFIDAYVTPLQYVIDEYRLYYNEYMLSYIANGHTDTGAVPVYIDSNGTVTAPHPSMPNYSVEGLLLRSSTAYRVAESELLNVQSKILSNRGRLYDGYWTDIVDDVDTFLPVDGDPVAITKEQYLNAVQVGAALYAMEKVGTANILNTFTGFCNAIAGQGTVSTLKPLDNYFVMISMYYNFYAEATTDIQTTIAWLGGFLAEAAGIATLAYEYTPAAPENLVNDAYNRAADKMVEAVKEKPDYYSYILGREIGIMRATAEIYKGAQPVGELVGELDFKMMINRFNNLKLAGATAASNFAEYLVSIKFCSYDMLFNEKGELRNMRFIISPMKFGKDFPFDDSLLARITRVQQTSWYDLNSMVSIGPKGKLTKKYIKNVDFRSADTIDVFGDVVHDHPFVFEGAYWEWHLYWLTDECWWFRYHLDATTEIRYLYVK